MGRNVEIGQAAAYLKTKRDLRDVYARLKTSDLQRIVETALETLMARTQTRIRAEIAKEIKARRARRKT